MKGKGPPRGIFIDDGDKASGILDSSGKVIIMTNPHLLGEEFARRYGASQTSSPDMGFADVIEDSDDADTPLQNASDMFGATAADLMLGGLTSITTSTNNHGQTVGPVEAFFPSGDFLAGDYTIYDLEGDGVEQFGGLDAGELKMNLSDVISFSDTDDEDSPTSPIYMPPAHQLAGIGNVNNEFRHLTNDNVTAFRRNADPSYAALNNTPSFGNFPPLFSPTPNRFSTPQPKRKRKNNDSPYNHSHYKGVDRKSVV